MGLGKVLNVLKTVGTVAGESVGIQTAEARMVAALERIAGALERAYPKREPLWGEKGELYPQLGITKSDNETLVEREQEDEERVRSREEKVMAEYKEFSEWKERQGK